jgi:DNA-directed RNA polymerase specialized sigma24 family protein
MSRFKLAVLGLLGFIVMLSFERLIGEYRWRLFKYLRGYGANYEKAEDVVQDTFLNAYKGSPIRQVSAC